MTLEECYRICDTMVLDENGCLLFPSATRGYHFPVWIKGPGGGSYRKVHRLILERKLGRPIRPGYHALHTCDHPSCVNPEHLYEGTDKDNARDRQLRNPIAQEHLKRIQKMAHDAWENPEYRAKRKEARKEKFRTDPVFRAKMLANFAKARKAAVEGVKEFHRKKREEEAARRKFWQDYLKKLNE
jgi:hypothetical protein